jgi:hypothetical protein
MKKTLELLWFEIALIALLCPFATLCRAQGEDAKLLADRFLEHMEANVPVAGTFDMTTTFDAGLYKKDHPPESVQVKFNDKYYKVKPQAQKESYQCSWAWDGNREVMNGTETEERSKTFLNTQEGFLEKAASKNYNLNRHSNSIASYRPAAFYFLHSTTQWKTLFAKCSFRTQEAAPGSPPGSMVLVAEISPQMKDLITLDAKTGRLYGYETLLDGQPLGRLAIERVATDPKTGRLFPSKATMMVYVPKYPGKPYRTDTLTARSVVFPESRDELQKFFDLTVPAEADIFDRVLNRQYKLARTTPAEAIIAGDLAALGVTEVRSLPPPRMLLSEVSWKDRYALIGGCLLGFCAIGVASLVAFRWLRRMRTAR